MKKIKDFINVWGGFIALSVIMLSLIGAFIAIECGCDSAFWRIIVGLLTAGTSGIISVAVFVTWVDAEEKWNKVKGEE